MVQEGELYLGIDGGGSGCRARLADGGGRRLGEGTAGPANISTDLSAAVGAIIAAAHAALRQAGLDEVDFGRVSAGLGLAGANASAAAAAFGTVRLPFAAARVASDAVTACLGAHRGEDGAILILGTGSQGVLLRDGAITTVGGWGARISDGGSGAVLGQAAARRALLAHEAIEPASPFTRDVMVRFADRPEAMLDFAVAATPADWAALAPLVFDHAGRGDPVATELIAGHVRNVTGLVERLLALGADRVALMGGLADPTRRHLPPSLANRLVQPAGDALDGALALAGLTATRTTP